MIFQRATPASCVNLPLYLTTRLITRAPCPVRSYYIFTTTVLILKGKASVPTADLIPKTKRCRNQHSMAFQTNCLSFYFLLLIQMFIKVASSPGLSGVGMPSPILWSYLLKMQRIVLLSLLLWWELGTNSLITGPSEWLLFRRFTSKLSWSNQALITHLPRSHCVLPDLINTKPRAPRSHSFCKFSWVNICKTISPPPPPPPAPADGFKERPWKKRQIEPRAYHASHPFCNFSWDNICKTISLSTPPRPPLLPPPKDSKRGRGREGKGKGQGRCRGSSSSSPATSVGISAVDDTPELYVVVETQVMMW